MPFLNGSRCYKGFCCHVYYSSSTEFSIKTSVTLKGYKGFSVNYVPVYLGKKHWSKEITSPYRNFTIQKSSKSIDNSLDHLLLKRCRKAIVNTEPSLQYCMIALAITPMDLKLCVLDSWPHTVLNNSAFHLEAATLRQSPFSRLVTNIYFQNTACYIIRTH